MDERSRLRSEQQGATQPGVDVAAVVMREVAIDAHRCPTHIQRVGFQPSERVGAPYSSSTLPRTKHSTNQMHIEPFKISISDEELSDLQTRLSRTRWPDELEDAGWEWGASLAYVRDLVEHWKVNFDWRQHEDRLNRLPQFMAQVGDQRIHFVHQRGVGPAPMPLVLTHGWPGSFAEMEKMIPLLVDPASFGADPRDAFDVVVPSMPGYGFSSRPTRQGMNPYAIAEIWSQLMTGLGYTRFGGQGGDWGASVTTAIGKQFPERTIGIHLNFVPGSYQPALSDGDQLSAEERDFLARRATWADLEGAYSHAQGTKPQSLGFGLNDSPAGLAAWVVEKFRSWSDCHGDVESRFNKNELLTNIAIYWFTETISSSMRLYRESRMRPMRFMQGERVQVPVGIAHMKFDVPCPPRSYVERAYNVVHWTEIPRGGHFAALEEPGLLAEDIRAFFRNLR